MEKGNAIVIMLLVVVLACGGFGLWADYQIKATTQANAVRIEQARTQQLEYLAMQERAAAQRAEAEKEQALYDAAGYAIETQADLTRYYAQRGDVRANTAWLWVVGLGVAVWIVRLAKPSPVVKNESPACLPTEAYMPLEAPERQNTYISIWAGR